MDRSHNSPYFQVVVVAVRVVLELEGGKVELHLLAWRHLDLPNTVSSVAVVPWPAGRADDAGRSEIIAAADCKGHE